MTDRPEPLRVPVTDDVACTLCPRAIPDGEAYDAYVMGFPQDDESFLLVVCERCAVKTLVLDTLDGVV
jgi:hypothetical protein